MKKTYITPRVEEITCSSMYLMAASVPYGEGTCPADDADAPDWFLDEDEEDEDW